MNEDTMLLFLSAVHQFVIFLFAQSESLWREGKQSSNASNVIMVRSERRSYHSPRFKNTESHHKLHKPPLTYDGRASDAAVYGTLTVRNREADWIKKEAAWMWCVMYKRRKTQYLTVAVAQLGSCEVMMPLTGCISDGFKTYLSVAG